MSIIKKVIAVVIIISVFILPGCENKKEVTEYDAIRYQLKSAKQ